ncbi:hypothetical protein FHK07_11875 [Listeria monocytogenes]|nr:hypothetical protein [Listeria monocytogenes]EJM6842170.1 hypothetical protein [Listeria monocytogenes]
MHAVDQLLRKYNSNRNKLSKKSGISPTTLSNIVNRNTPIDKIDARLLKALSIETNQLMDDVYEQLKDYEEAQ